MQEQFTPSEHAAAQDKLKQREKGREEAAYYRKVVENFGKEVLAEAVRQAGIQQGDNAYTSKKLGDFGRINTESLKIILEDAVDLAGEELHLQDSPVEGDVSIYLEMTPVQFDKHIQKQIDSLIKD